MAEKPQPPKPDAESGMFTWSPITVTFTCQKCARNAVASLQQRDPIPVFCSACQP